MPLPTPFNPSPELTEQVLHQLASADRSLGEIALNHNTTLPALILWMAKPDIAQQIDALESAFARHQRLAALNRFPAINRALSAIIDEFNNDPPPDRAERLRAADLTRQACALLMRLARFTPGPSRYRAPEPNNASPAPGGGGGRGSARPEGASPPYSRAEEAAAFLQQHLASLADTHPDELIDLLNEHPDQQDPDDEPHNEPTTARAHATSPPPLSLVVQASSLHASQPEGRNRPSPRREPWVANATTSRALEEGATTTSDQQQRDHLTHLLNTIDLTSFPTRPGHTPPTLYGPNGPIPNLAVHPP